MADLADDMGFPIPRPLVAPPPEQALVVHGRGAGARIPNRALIVLLHQAESAEPRLAAPRAPPQMMAGAVA